MFLGILLGIALAFLLTLLFGVYTIGPTERGVLTTFGRADRTTGFTSDDPTLGSLLTDEEKQRYNYPNIRVIPPGGPFFKWPWQKLHKVDMTIQTVDITWDPEIRQDSIEAVTKDNLTVQISGQIRWKPCERNLYAYLFGISHPSAHVVGYFISVLRDRIATFHGEAAEGAVEGVSINDLRRNLSLINSFMEDACRKTAARYGIDLDAALITNIDPPSDVDEALASINTTQNQVAASISGQSRRRPETKNGRTSRPDRREPRAGRSRPAPRTRQNPRRHARRGRQGRARQLPPQREPPAPRKSRPDHPQTLTHLPP